MSVLIDLSQAAYMPGETLAGTVHWDLEKETRRIDVNLFWFTDGKGNRDVGLVDSIRVERPTRQGEKTFSFQLPTQPLSFSGRLITLTWAIEALAQGTNETASAEFLLSRDGQEVRILHDPSE